MMIEQGGRASYMKYNKKLVLIDAHALIHRAFHALPPTLSTSEGIPTNAVFGFFSVLIKMIKDLRPDYIAAAFDLAGPTFRHEEFAEYKSHRIKAPDGLYLQIPYIKELLGAFGIPIFEKQGFEADDLIGALAEQGKATKDLQVVIMTGDLDTLQLVEDDHVVVFTLRKGVTDTMTYNEDEVEARYGLKPSQLIDFKGLKGDPSDNIPGVPGIGDKTASTLIKEFGSLEHLYESLEKPSKSKKETISPKLKEKLLTNKDQAFFSKRLATIIRDVEISFDLHGTQWRAHYDRAKLEKMLKDLALYSIAKRLAEIEPGASPELKAQPLSLFEATHTATTQLVSDSAEAVKKLKAFQSAQEIVFDFTEGAFIFSSKPQEVSGFCQVLLDNSDVREQVRAILEDQNIKKIVHDSKYIARQFFARNIYPAGIVFDTKLAMYVLNSDVKDYDLGKLYFMEFGRDIAPEPLQRPEAIRELYKRLKSRLSALELNDLLDKVEMPLSPILALMEQTGIRIDTKAVQILSKKTTEEIARLEKEIYKAADGEFNINSPSQLSKILFEKLALKGKVKKTGKGALSTAAGELEKLIEEHPVIELILRYRELQKLKTTYIEPFPHLIASDGRLHTTYNQTGAVTGRLSSENPNLQNIPIRTELGQEFRRAFVADQGKELVSFDYSQLELRIAAHISGDQKMTEAFQKGEDIHTRTAAEIWEISPDKVTSNMRRQAKVLNFGILYGMGVLGFQRASGVDRQRAKEFIEKYFKEFTGVADYMAKMKTKVHRDKFVTTVFGRRRQFPEIDMGAPQLIAQAERMAINMPVQGTAADLIKLAMIKIQELINKKYKDSVAMLLQVHDELLFEMEPTKAKAASKEIKEIMETVHTFNVPIVVDVKAGKNWSEMEAL